MLVKRLNEKKENSKEELHYNDEEQQIALSVNKLITKLIEYGNRIVDPSELYKHINISADAPYNYKYIELIANHKQLFAETEYLKSSHIKQHKMVHIYYNVFERLLFELDLFHIFFAYNVWIDNHSPWDNLNPSSLFVLVGNLQKLYEKSQPTQQEIKLFFDKSQRFIPLLKYKCVNSNKWKTDSFINVNADINNDYNYCCRILHDQLFDDINDNKDQNDDNKDKEENEEEVVVNHAHNNSDNRFYYQIYVVDKQNNNKSIMVHSGVIMDTFNVNTNEELSRNMIIPSMYLSTGHILSARKWIPESDLYGIVTIKCHNTLLIEKNSFISATGAGYTSHFGKGHGIYYKEPNRKNQGNKYYSGGGYGTNGKDAHHTMAIGGRNYGDKKLENKLHFGSPSGGRERGGGIIELIAKNIINYGKIGCDGDNGNQFGGGSGGSIKIICKKFINHGKITAKGGKGGIYERNYQTTTALRIGGDGGHGRIAVYCQQYINVGIISPNPYVETEKFKYSDDIDFTLLALATENQFHA